MDLSKLSDEQLKALSSGDMSNLPNAVLQSLVSDAPEEKSLPRQMVDTVASAASGFNSGVEQWLPKREVKPENQQAVNETQQEASQLAKEYPIPNAIGKGAEGLAEAALVSKGVGGLTGGLSGIAGILGRPTAMTAGMAAKGGIKPPAEGASRTDNAIIGGVEGMAMGVGGELLRARKPVQELIGRIPLPGKYGTLSKLFKGSSSVPTAVDRAGTTGARELALSPGKVTPQVGPVPQTIKPNIQPPVPNPVNTGSSQYSELGSALERPITPASVGISPKTLSPAPSPIRTGPSQFSDAGVAIEKGLVPAEVGIAPKEGGLSKVLELVKGSPSVGKPANARAYSIGRDGPLPELSPGESLGDYFKRISSHMDSKVFGK